MTNKNINYKADFEEFKKSIMTIIDNNNSENQKKISHLEDEIKQINKETNSNILDINKNINKISELIERNDNKLENLNKNKKNKKKS